jgi:hypothetical protein
MLISAIDGTAGIGKTALAVPWRTRWPNDSPAASCM